MLRVGIVGYGAIGHVHQRAIENCSGAELVAVVTRGTDPEIPGVTAFSDLREMLNLADVDVVVICTPSGLHPEQALTALEAGKNVVIEKPLSLDLESGQRIITEARVRGLQLSVISQRRFEPQNAYVKALLHEAQLGKPYL